MAWLRLSSLVAAVSAVAACTPLMVALTAPAGLKRALEAPSLPFRTLYIANHAILGEGVAVINSDDEHATVWKPIQDNKPAVPKPDFTKETGIVAQFATQYSGQFRSEITAVEVQAEMLMVHTVLWEPEPGQPHTTGIGRPIHYIAIPKTTNVGAALPTPIKAYITLRPSNRPWPSPDASVPSTSASSIAP